MIDLKHGKKGTDDPDGKWNKNRATQTWRKWMKERLKKVRDG